MTDRELLEAAAKAAGLTNHRYCEPWRGMAAYTPQDGYYGPTWNPLTDDGDALRLMVKLRIDVAHTNIHSPQVHALADAKVQEWEDSSSDPYAATRRAITRAAAETGRSMK